MPEIQDRQVGFAAESIRHFFDCLIEDKKPVVGGKDGLAVTRIIQAAEESAASGQAVEL